MKIYIQNLATLSAVIAFAGHSGATEPNAAALRPQTTSSNDAIGASQANPVAVKTIEGTVKTIVNGKDGFTALIQANDGLPYFATVSHSSLKDPKAYRSFKPNEKVCVSGDFWEMADESHLTVREIL